MANVLTFPNSGVIAFDSRDFSTLSIPELSSSAKISYDNGGGIIVSSLNPELTALTRFSVDGINGRLFSVVDTLSGSTVQVAGNITAVGDISANNVFVDRISDARFGPWSSVSDAIANITIEDRELGLTIGVSGIDGLSEYWFKNGISDGDLVLKDTTLSYNVSAEILSNSIVSFVSLSSLSYRNIVDDAVFDNGTLAHFVSGFTGDIHPGYTLTLRNGKVYTFAGTDKNNPNHYLEINSNPYKPIYREVPLSANEIVIDKFYLGDFKTAKYTLQVETNFDNEIYYSEINVVGSVQTSTGVACEYGQIFTNQLVLNYAVNVNLNQLELVMYVTYDPDPGKKYIVKGHRTNFYKI
jgi:hypothetical protein